MIKKSKKLVSILLCIAIFVSLATPVLADTASNSVNSGTTITNKIEVANTASNKLEAIPRPVQPEHPKNSSKQALDAFGNNKIAKASDTEKLNLIKKNSKLQKHSDLLNKEVIKPIEKVDKIKQEFNPVMLQIAAYFYPNLFPLLDEKQQVEMINWDTEKVNQLIVSLNKKQQALLDKYAPIATEQYDFHKDQKSYQDKHPILYDKQDEQANEQKIKQEQKNLKKFREDHPTANEPQKVAKNANKVSALSLSTYKVNAFTNKYNYKVNTDDLVDPVYRTANHGVTDVSLSGKSGLGISLNRNYNSLQANILSPEYKAYLDTTTGQYTQESGNVAVAVNPSDIKGFIATGWTMNIPQMTKANIEAELRNSVTSSTCSGGYLNTNICYTSSYTLEALNSQAYEKVVFTLDSGESYEFHNGVVFDYPYQNVTYGKEYNSYTARYEYILTIDGQISYFFDDQGNIIKKINLYGDQVSYNFNNSTQIVITDSYQRVITIFKNSSQAITGFNVIDPNNGNVLMKNIQYNVTQGSSTLPYRRWTSNGYQNTSSTVTYWQLNDVRDITAGQPGKLLESYDYYNVDSTTLSDFNYKPDGYSYKSIPNGDPAPDPAKTTNPSTNYWSTYAYWINNNEYFELWDIMTNSWNTYGETPNLLLKNINFFNGLTTRFNYQQYNPSWYLQPTWPDMENTRGTTRQYQDDYALQFASYHAVERVDFIYAENGVSKLLSDYYYNMHWDHGWNWKEYWKNSKQNIPRLRTSSRFGDKQTIQRSTMNADGNYWNNDFNQYLNNGKDFVKIFSWNYLFGQYTWGYTMNNGVQYGQRDNEVTAYEYDSNQKQPKAVHTFAANLPDYQNITIPTIAGRANKTTQTMTYDNWGYVLSQVDAIGNTIANQYNGPYHQLSKKTVTSQDGLSNSIQDTLYYSSSDVDVNKRNELWKVITNQKYKNPTNLTEEKSDITISESISYGSNHQVTQIKETASGSQFSLEQTTTQKDYTYTNRDQVDTETSRVTLGSGQPAASLVVDYDYDVKGNLIKQKYPDQSYVVYGYDYLDRLTSNQFNPAGTGSNARTTSVEYDDSLRKVKVTVPDGEIQETFYSPFGLDIKSQRTVNATTRITNINESYDGQRVMVSKPYGQDALKTQYWYDSASRVKASTNSLNQTTWYYYTNFAKLDQAGGYEYLSNNSLSSSQDGSMHFTIGDQFGRVKEVEEDTPNYTKYRKTTNQYSSMGKVLASSLITYQGTQTTSFGYDGGGNMIYLKDALNQVNQYVYNRNGQMNEMYTNGTLQKKNTYNEIGLVLSKTNAANEQENYAYTNTGLVSKYKDKAGQANDYTYTPYYEQDRISIKNPTGTEIFWQQNNYDPSTRLLQSQTSSENESLSYHYDMWKRNDEKVVAGQTYRFGHDAYDRMESIIYPDNKQVTYGYDSGNRVSTVSYPDIGLVPVSYTYAVASNEHKVTLNYPNGLKQETKRDGFNELVSMNHLNSSNVSTRSESFTYDGFGNQTNINRSVNQNTTTYNYSYDSLNRIQTENVAGAGATYTYDDRGNRLTMDNMSTVNDISMNRNLTYSALNQLKTYNDDNGTQASYTYYTDGLRATKSVNGQFTRYVYVNGKVIDELDVNGNSKARNIWGNELLFRKNSTMTDTQAGFYFYNGHGDVVKITDSAGNTLNTYDYDTWGNITSKTESMNNPFKYTGEVQDDETGYIYLRARYYDPSIGRFNNEDSVEGKIDNPLTLNRYTYVHNNPINNIDPTGHWCTSADGKYSHAGGCDGGKKGVSVRHDLNGSKWTPDPWEVALKPIDWSKLYPPTPVPPTPAIPKVEAKHTLVETIRNTNEDFSKMDFGYKLLIGEDVGIALDPDLSVKEKSKALLVGRAVGVGMLKSPNIPLGRGSTALKQPQNLNQQLAIQQAVSNPEAGIVLKSIKMNDPRWSASDGWVKMSQNINGNEIHYVRNTISGEIDDFKLK